MVLNVISIRDAKSGVFSRPQSVVSLGVGRRMFGDLALDSNSDVGRHPEDFALYHLGDFDDVSGALINNPQPAFVCNAIDFVNSK